MSGLSSDISNLFAWCRPVNGGGRPPHTARPYPGKPQTMDSPYCRRPLPVRRITSGDFALATAPSLPDRLSRPHPAGFAPAGTASGTLRLQSGHLSPQRSFPREGPAWRWWKTSRIHKLWVFVQVDSNQSAVPGLAHFADHSDGGRPYGPPQVAHSIGPVVDQGRHFRIGYEVCMLSCRARPQPICAMRAYAAQRRCRVLPRRRAS